MFGCLVSEGAESFSSENGAEFREAQGFCWFQGELICCLDFGTPRKEEHRTAGICFMASTAMQRQRTKKHKESGRLKPKVW